jgi:hypothetical protein
MPARTRKIFHDDETRAKIQAAQIINRFMACLNGEIELTAAQVSCGKTLLNKVLPDLQATSVTGAVATGTMTKEQRDSVAAAFARRDN